MIRYLGPEDDIWNIEMRPGQIILNLAGKDWLSYDNALIVAEVNPVLRIWQPERDLDDGHRLTGRRNPPPHPSLDTPPSLYYLSAGDLFICDTADEANEIIEASLPARMAQTRVAAEVYADKPEYDRRLSRDDVDRMLEVRRSSRAEVAAVYADLTDGAFTDPEADRNSGVRPR